MPAAVSRPNAMADAPFVSSAPPAIRQDVIQAQKSRINGDNLLEQAITEPDFCDNPQLTF